MTRKKDDEETYIDAHKETILGNLPYFFADQLVEDPEAFLEHLERELRSLYVRQGNDWTPGAARLVMPGSKRPSPSLRR